MITINMVLFPQGLGLLRRNIVEGTIHTSEDGKEHVYYLEIGDDVFKGSFPKEFSGHRNPLKLLSRIIRDIEEKA